MIRSDTEEIARRLRDTALIDQAILAARRSVIRFHQQAGVPLAIWRDGRVVEVAPETLGPDGEELTASAKPVG